MRAGWYRPLMLAAAVVMALAGAFSMLFLGSPKPAMADYSVYTVEISDVTVNPGVCNINRDDEVVWKNIGSQVHRIVIPDAGVGSKPIYDSGDIQPGQASSPAVFSAGSKWTYHDQYSPSITGVIDTPGTSETQLVSCSPLPPTPTPTATPLPTTPTPTPTPVVPAGCKWVGCAVAVAVTHE